jgi:hypothetical protein
MESLSGASHGTTTSSVSSNSSGSTFGKLDLRVIVGFLSQAINRRFGTPVLTGKIFQSGGLSERSAFECDQEFRCQSLSDGAWTVGKKVPLNMDNSISQILSCVLPLSIVKRIKTCGITKPLLRFKKINWSPYDRLEICSAAVKSRQGKPEEALCAEDCIGHCSEESRFASVKVVRADRGALTLEIPVGMLPKSRYSMKMKIYWTIKCELFAC